MTRLNIDLFNGTLEVDGEESFVKLVYDDFKEQLASAPRPVVADAALPTPHYSDDNTAEQVNRAVRGVKKSTYKRPKSNFSIVKNLDLSAKINSQSLREFYAAKSPVTAMECNAVFVYYLQRIIGVNPIMIDHIYSCYKDVNIKYPNALKQSIADTSSRRGWLDTRSFEDIRIATPGENYVEHDLPKRAV